ncbi:MAG: hypothetical protein J0H74_28600 [Chitinophagaceae bacterium]|nr:hypothetical protein [Chitinophagaceae bacterium]
MLFDQIEPPLKHRAFTRRHNANWYSWSRFFRQEFRQFRQSISSLHQPELLYIKDHKDYNYTYSAVFEKKDEPFMRDFKHFAFSLYHFDPKDRLNFFTGMIDSQITDQYYHKIISLIRVVITRDLKDPMAALYAPLTPGKAQSDFPLHCDLYIPKILFNVFGKVATDGSGRSTFLPLDTFFNLLNKVPSMPVDIRNQIKNIFKEELKSDHYEKFYSLLYNEENSWSADLKKVLAKAKISIGLQKGEGYMINDRVWMHGRDRTTGGISRKRLHRLIFTNIYQK